MSPGLSAFCLCLLSVPPAFWFPSYQHYFLYCYHCPLCTCHLRHKLSMKVVLSFQSGNNFRLKHVKVRRLEVGLVDCLVLYDYIRTIIIWCNERPIWLEWLVRISRSCLFLGHKCYLSLSSVVSAYKEMNILFTIFVPKGLMAETSEKSAESPMSRIWLY